MMYSTNYKVAANWCGNALILCNDIPQLDPSVIENMRFETYNEEEDTYKEIYQWFLTDCNEFDMQFLEEHFGLLFTYSDLLGLWVLCVDHYGTSWDYVECDTDLKNAARKLGESK